MTDLSRPRAVLQAGGSDRWDDRADLLTDAELERATSYRRDQDRRDFVAARALARIVVGDLAAMPPTGVTLHQRCETCGSQEHGRPTAWIDGTQVCVSWSHSGGAVAAVASLTPVGVDVERVGPMPAVAGVLSPGESRAVAEAPDPRVEFLRWWTRKETLVKVGACSIDDFGAIDLSSGQGRWGRWQHRTWHDPQGGFVVSLASTDAPDPGPLELLILPD